MIILLLRKGKEGSIWDEPWNKGRIAAVPNQKYYQKLRIKEQEWCVYIWAMVCEKIKLKPDYEGQGVFN